MLAFGWNEGARNHQSSVIGLAARDVRSMQKGVLWFPRANPQHQFSPGGLRSGLFGWKRLASRPASAGGCLNQSWITVGCRHPPARLKHPPAHAGGSPGGSWSFRCQSAWAIRYAEHSPLESQPHAVCSGFAFASSSQLQPPRGGRRSRGGDVATPVWAQQRPVDEKRLADIKAKYTKYEYRIPMRDGKRLFTAVYVPKDQSQKYPIMLNRTPYSVQPYGADEYKRSARPVDAVRQGGLHLRPAGRARPLDVGGRVRQHAAPPGRQEKADRHRRIAATPTTPSTGSSSTSPATTARSGSGAFRTPASTPSPA